MLLKEDMALWLWSEKCTFGFPCLVFGGGAAWTKSCFSIYKQ